MKKLFLLLSIFSLLVSCDESDIIRITGADNPVNNKVEDNEKDNEEDLLESTLLIYAVASNNLEYFFDQDTTEMTVAGKKIDLTRNEIFLYSITSQGNPTLKRMIRQSDGNASFSTVKEYDRNLYSTDPRRINEVIKYTQSIAKGDTNGIIFWSHGTSWLPDNTLHDPLESPKAFSYGQDKTPSGLSDYCNIDELAKAIPEGVYDFIWFDCCYMSSIETLYELKSKAPIIVAYPTEVDAEGMPYNITMPYLTGKEVNIIGAADQFTEYYDQIGSPYTITVVDTSVLNEVAEAVKNIYDLPVESFSQINNYSRLSVPLYDFSQLILRKTNNIDDFSQENFLSIASRLVLYKAASDVDFRRREIDKNNYCGISVYNMLNNNSPREDYYKNLAWWKKISSI